MPAYAPALPEATAAVCPVPSYGLTRDEVMTAREVADLLKMPVSTIYELARRGELPARRLGRTGRVPPPRPAEGLAGLGGKARGGAPAPRPPRGGGGGYGGPPPRCARPP